MAAAFWKDRIKVASATTGTGTLTLGAAASGYRTFASGDNGRLFPYVIEDGTAWETGYGTYTHSGTTFARTTRTDSSTGSALSLSGAEFLFVDLIADWLGGHGDYVGELTSAEVAITTTATATINRQHLISGTSADYTVTLPAASGNGGKFLSFRVSPSATKLFTIDGNASETIDGALTRILWTSETATLYCDGSNWFKTAGRSLPMAASMYRAAAQSIANASIVKIGLDAIGTNAGGMADTTNGRINIKRPANYIITALIGYMSGLDSTSYSQNRIHKDGATTTAIGLSNQSWYGPGPGFPAHTTQVIDANVAGGTYELYTYQASGITASLYVTEPLSRLSVVEILGW